MNRNLTDSFFLNILYKLRKKVPLKLQRPINCYDNYNDETRTLVGFDKQKKKQYKK